MARDSRRQVLKLWQSLAPGCWPVPPAALPPRTVLVGGAVRDALLGRLGLRPDLDFVVEEDAVALTRCLASRLGGTCVVLDAERSIARLVIGGWTIDMARCAGGSLTADLGRRDYTINAIALPLSRLGADSAEAEAGGEEGAPGSLIDPHGGVGDLRKRRIMAIGEANLLADPLRLLRGIRLSVELDFRIASRTWTWIRTHRDHLAAVAGERVLAELERIAAAPQGQRGLRRVAAAGLLDSLREEGPREAPGSAETRLLTQLTPSRAQAMGFSGEETARGLPLARLALTVEVGLLRRLHASRRLQDRCTRVRRWWVELGSLSQGPPAIGNLSEERRLSLHRSMEQDLPALLLLLDPLEARPALQRWRDPGDPLFHPRSPVDGHRLQQALGLDPGRELGRLIDHLTLERAFGRLPADIVTGDEALTEVPQEVLQEARRWLQGEGMRHDG